MSSELPGPPFPAHAPDVLPRWRAGPRSAIQTEKQAWQPALPDRGWVDALLRAGEAEAGETEAGGRGEGGCRGWELDVLTDTENWISWAACCWAPIPPAPSPRFWGDWKAHQGPMCSPPVLARAPGAGRGWGGAVQWSARVFPGSPVPHLNMPAPHPRSCSQVTRSIHRWA